MMVFSTHEPFGFQTLRSGSPVGSVPMIGLTVTRQQYTKARDASVSPTRRRLSRPLSSDSPLLRPKAKLDNFGQPGAKKDNPLLEELRSADPSRPNSYDFRQATRKMEVWNDIDFRRGPNKHEGELMNEEDFMRGAQSCSQPRRVSVWGGAIPKAAITDKGRGSADVQVWKESLRMTAFQENFDQLQKRGLA